MAGNTSNELDLIVVNDVDHSGMGVERAESPGRWTIVLPGEFERWNFQSALLLIRSDRTRHLSVRRGNSAAPATGLRVPHGITGRARIERPGRCVARQGRVRPRCADFVGLVEERVANARGRRLRRIAFVAASRLDRVCAAVAIAEEGYCRSPYRRMSVVVRFKGFGGAGAVCATAKRRSRMRQTRSPRSVGRTWSTAARLAGTSGGRPR